MEQEREAQAGKKHTFECGSCGASLTFAPGTTSLECEYCGHQQDIPGGEGGGGVEREVVEYDFADGLAKARRAKASDLVQGGKEVSCNGCGAKTVMAEQSGNCPYCDTPMVAAVEDDAATLILPESVLPFKVDDRKARDKFHEWIGSLWFAPNDLKQRASADRIDGVYMPYWTYDSNTTTQYRGQRGEHYYETERYTDSEGNSQTRQVRKTRWYSASGTVRVDFDDVLVYASKSLPRSLVRKLEPWDLNELKPYEPAYLSGFVAERYAIGLEEGFKVAEDRMEPKIRSTIRSDIGGDEQRIHWMSVHHANVTWKHTLLPLWISSFRYNDKVYRFMVNARSGEVAGERPWSVIKIVLAVLFAIAVIGGIIVLAQSSGAR
jgi:uncharacterized CHY-type Zn-finger protein